MAYAVIADVQALNSQRTEYFGTSNPSAVEVTGFITKIAAEIDSVLDAQGVTVPAAAPTHFVTFLTDLNALGAAAMAEMAQFPESDGGQGSSPQGERYWRMYKEGLKTLIDGTAIPDSAVVSTGGTALTARSYGVDNPDTDGNPPAALFSTDSSVRVF